MTAALRMGLVVALFAAALVAIIWQRVDLLDTGREVTLAVEPVDPTDFFRGEYVSLNYVGLSQIALPPGNSVAGLREGDPVYVALEVAPDGHATVGNAHATLAAARAESPVVIKGRVQWTYTKGLRDDVPGQTQLRTRYGIEAYFVPQGEARALEQARNAKRLEMLIAVGHDGEAAIKGLVLDGKRAYVEGLF